MPAIGASREPAFPGWAPTHPCDRTRARQVKARPLHQAQNEARRGAIFYVR